jgi:hypothetical protein
MMRPVLDLRINSREQIIALSRPLLEPDEVVAHVVRAMEGPNRLVAVAVSFALGLAIGGIARVPFLAAPIAMAAFFSSYPRRIILATDQALVILKGGRWRWTPKQVLDRLDVDTPIDPKGMFLRSQLGSRRLWIVPRCINEVRASDLDLED